MGAWDVALYSNDTALDVKSGLEIWLRIPGTADDLVDALISGAALRRDENDEDYPDFWLALADGLHRHGIEHPETFSRARHIITSGLDLDCKRALGLGPQDEDKRRAVLQTLLQTWSRPHPKPRRRKVLAKPEPHAFPVGAILVYPTEGGAPKNYADTRNLFGWEPDGWGSVVVLAQGHAHGFFAWACLGRLSAHGVAKPTLAACVASSIENQPWFMQPDGEGTLAIDINALEPINARRMGFENIGQVPLDAAAVARLHPAVDQAKRPPFSTFHDLPTWWAKGVQPKRQSRDPGIATPSPCVPLRTLLRG